MMECRLERSKRDDEVSEPVSIGQLAKDENQQMVPACKTFDILISIVFIYYTVEHPLWEKFT